MATEHNVPSTCKPYKFQIIWFNVIMIILVHLGALYGLIIRSQASWPTIIYAKFLLVMTNVAILGGAHRLWAHRTYKANTSVQIIWLFFLSHTHQGSIYKWIRDHRLHHKYSETDADPHNAKRGFFFAHIGWLMVKKHPELLEKGKELDTSDLSANELLMFHNRHYFKFVLLGIILPCLISCVVWGEKLKVAFCYLVLYRYVVSLHCTLSINSFAHLYGNKPYDKRIHPVESTIVTYVGFGEGFHNYHHTFPWDYKASEFGNDIRNITTMFIDMFAMLGWVTERRSVNPNVIGKRVSETGDDTYEDKSRFVSLLSNFIPSEYAHNIQSYIIMAFVLCLLC